MGLSEALARSRPILILMALAALAATACRASPLGATEPELDRGRNATSRGALLFADECARCHGRHGEGMGDRPAILGPHALPVYAHEAPASGIPGVYDLQELQIESQTRRTGPPVREPFRDAQDLCIFLNTHGPKQRMAAIRPEGILTIVAFLLAVQGAAIPAGGLTFDNASTVLIPRR